MKLSPMVRALAPSAAALAVVVLAGPGCLVRVGGWNSVSFDHQNEREETHALELASGQTLTLDGSSGDIRVSASRDGRSELRARIRAWGRTSEEAEAVLARYHVEVVNDASGARARLVGDPLALSEGSTKLRISADVDYEASVPEGTLLVAGTASGDIEARGPLAACRLDATYGNIEVEGVRGALEAHTSSGNVRAVRVECDEIELESDYGNVRVEEAAAERIVCESDSGDVDLESARAPSVQLATSYGSVEVRELTGDLHARSGSGNVRVHDVAGKIDAESDYGDVEVEGVVTDLRAGTDSGDVRVRALPGSRVEQAWSLWSDYGAVVLHAPEDFACELDARTDYGAVESDFPIFSETSRRQRDSSIAGRVGDGGPSVTLRTSSGKVALKKL